MCGDSSQTVASGMQRMLAQLGALSADRPVRLILHYATDEEMLKAIEGLQQAGFSLHHRMSMLPCLSATGTSYLWLQFLPTAHPRPVDVCLDAAMRGFDKHEP